MIVPVPMLVSLIMVAAIVPPLAAAAQAPPVVAPPRPEAIADNSFLIEEAYNQEPGVSQFIFNFIRIRPEGSWLMSMTNEWPVPGMRHQFSYAIPFAAGTSMRDGVGDIQLNYRFQALEESRTGVAFAPRFSISVPTGDAERGLGVGATGYQVGLPFSKRLGNQFAAHVNLGATVWPGVRIDGLGEDARATLAAATQGGSVIWLVSPVLNVFVECAALQAQLATDAGDVRWGHQLLVNPGVRAAVNTTAGQLVLGVSAPIGVTADSPETSVFLYLSWEMPVWRPR